MRIDNIRHHQLYIPEKNTVSRAVCIYAQFSLVQFPVLQRNDRLRGFHVLFEKTVPPLSQPVTSFQPKAKEHAVIIAEGCSAVGQMSTKTQRVTRGQQLG